MKNITTEMADNMKPNDDILTVNQNNPTSKMVTSPVFSAV